MESNIREAIHLSINALNSGNYEDDVIVLNELKRMYEQPYEGRDLGIGTLRYRGFRNSWHSIKLQTENLKTIDHKLTWESVLLVLFDFGNYNEPEMLELAFKVNDAIIFNHLLKHIIANLIKQEKISEAEEYIPHFRTTHIFKEEDNQDEGYLLILNFYAGKGDADNFFKYFKKCDPRKNKHHVTENKGWLVETYAALHPIESAIELCKHKNLGEKYTYYALYAYARQGLYQELKAIFNQYPTLKQSELETELSILIIAYSKAKRESLINIDDFEELFIRATMVDRKLKWGDCKLQDSLFLDLGLASEGNKERITRCKKAIKNNSLKKELFPNKQ
jgi:hypothetical protein